jgi:hypothetical protein
VRCLCPYRPSHVDLGVGDVLSLEDLVAQRSRSGTVEILERTADTVHLRWNDINVSVLVLGKLAPFASGRRLNDDCIMATKLHAVLDRGTRRNFFDLYVTLQDRRLGIAACLRAIRVVYKREVNEPLLLRALTFFDDAEREAPCAAKSRGTGSASRTSSSPAWDTCSSRPGEPLEIQNRRVDIAPDAR